VTATNGVGTGPASAASNAVTPSSGPPPSPNPMGLSGFTSDSSGSARSLAASVGGVVCASYTVPAYSAYYTLSLASTCGVAGQAVTFTLGGVAAGLQTSAGATCVAFAPGTSVFALKVVDGGTPSSSCATAAAQLARILAAQPAGRGPLTPA